MELPTIMVCPRDQYDWFESKNMGYPLRFSFLLGMINKTNGNLTWGGSDNKMMFQESLKSLYKASFENLSTTPNTVVMKERFIIPYGFCQELTNYSTSDVIYIYSGNNSVFITDPLKTLHYKISESSMTGDPIFLKAKDSKIHDHLIFAIDIEEKQLFKDKSGEECTDYGETEKYRSYAECKRAEVELQLIPDLNCIPPWMASINQCNGIIKRSYSNKTIDFLETLLAQAERTLDHITDSCKPSCVQTMFHSKFLINLKSINHNQSIEINFNPTVKVSHNSRSYAGFDFIVEIGSALGLWIGLSALGLYDVIISVFICSIKKLNSILFKVNYK